MKRNIDELICANWFEFQNFQNRAPYTDIYLQRSSVLLLRDIKEKKGYYLHTNCLCYNTILVKFSRFFFSPSWVNVIRVTICKRQRSESCYRIFIGLEKCMEYFNSFATSFHSVNDGTAFLLSCFFINFVYSPSPFMTQRKVSIWTFEKCSHSHRKYWKPNREFLGDFAYFLERF